MTGSNELVAKNLLVHSACPTEPPYSIAQLAVLLCAHFWKSSFRRVRDKVAILPQLPSRIHFPNISHVRMSRGVGSVDFSPHELELQDRYPQAEF
jgi:hypothetical protein